VADGWQRAAALGPSTTHRRVVPLTHRGEVAGRLVLGWDDQPSLRNRDERILAQIAGPLSLAVGWVQLADDLRRSSVAVVSAREEERRRLRRDLHDGLGPLLTSVGLNLDAARSRLAAGNGDTLTLLARAKDASSQAIADLRTVVYSLRPPALDDLGVVGAITAHLHLMEQTGTIDVEVENHGLPALPAAVEVALFRIAVEGVTNVVRHSEANCCRVRLGAADASAYVEVVDDGVSDVAWTPGVGIVAMRERVSELGGTLEVGPTANGGRLLASFPLTRSQVEVSA
jgi:signal transduction histidine kinase